MTRLISTKPFPSRAAFCGLLVASWLLFAGSPTWALPDDKDQPIKIQSNQAKIDDGKGIAIYEGDVVVVQGSIRLAADKVTVYNDDDGISKIIAKGQPAHYQQVREVNAAPTHAYGNTIDYRIRDEFIRILENAKLEENDNSFSGERIDYNMKQRMVNAYSAKSGKEADNGSRIEIILQPNSLPSSDSKKDQ